MKKIFIVVMTFALFPIVGMSETVKVQECVTVNSMVDSNDVVFRSTQRLKSRDGRSIYLYRSGTCELFDGDRLIASCTYRLQNGEVRLLDERGNTVYKGTYRMKSDRLNLQSLTLAGTTYVAF